MSCRDTDLLNLLFTDDVADRFSYSVLPFTLCLQKSPDALEMLSDIAFKINILIAKNHCFVTSAHLSVFFST